MNLDLNALLADLENSAGIEKTASASTGLTPAIKSELAGVLEKKAEQDMTKVAMDEGAALAKQLLEKLANEIQDGNAVMEAQDGTKEVATQGGTLTDLLQDTVNQGVARGATSDDLVDEALDKQAQENKVMAQSIMKKIAQIVGEPTTTPAAAINVAGAAVPNMVQMGNAGMTAWDDSKVTPMPGQEGTINNILEALVAKAQAEGGGSDDLVNGTGAVEGAVALGSAEDQVEKAAAVNALVSEGVDFDTAVDLVKQAEDMIYQEEMEYEKQAAFEALVNEGMDFDDAVELVKAAELGLYKEAGVKEMYESAKEKGVQAGEAVSSEYRNLVRNGRQLYHGDGLYGRTGSAKGLAGNRIVQGAAALAAIGGGAYAYNHHQEKKAALDALMAEGINFDTAVDLVKEAGLTPAKELSLAERVVRGVKGEYKDLVRHGKNLYTGRGVKGRAGSAEGLARNHIVQGAAGTAAAGGAYAAYRHNEKKAAMEVLMDEGIDFDTAVDLVKQAEYEIYGD